MSFGGGTVGTVTGVSGTGGAGAGTAPTIISGFPGAAPAAAPSTLATVAKNVATVAQAVQPVISSIATFAGTAAEVRGAQQQAQIDINLAQAEQDIARQDAELAQEIADEKEQEALEDATRLAAVEQRRMQIARSVQVARFARSGVVVGVGSPLLTEIESIRRSRESVDDILLSGGRGARDIRLEGALRVRAAQVRQIGALTRQSAARAGLTTRLGSIATRTAARFI